MRFVDIEVFAENPGKVLEELKTQGDIVMTSKGNPAAILLPTDEDRLEGTVAAIRAARAVQAVNALQAETRRIGTDRISEEEIEREIYAARRKRKVDRTP